MCVSAHANMPDAAQPADPVAAGGVRGTRALLPRTVRLTDRRKATTSVGLVGPFIAGASFKLGRPMSATGREGSDKSGLARRSSALDRRPSPMAGCEGVSEGVVGEGGRTDVIRACCRCLLDPPHLEGAARKRGKR